MAKIPMESLDFEDIWERWMSVKDRRFQEWFRLWVSSSFYNCFLVVIEIIIDTNMLRCHYRFNNEIVISFHHVCSLVSLIL
jgi:hypothetical protein